jgi:hypothetical protein
MRVAELFGHLLFEVLSDDEDELQVGTDSMSFWPLRNS